MKKKCNFILRTLTSKIESLLYHITTLTTDRFLFNINISYFKLLLRRNFL